MECNHKWKEGVGFIVNRFFVVKVAMYGIAIDRHDCSTPGNVLCKM
jgi:hypothetical protein